MNKIDFLKEDYEYQRGWITHANSAAAIGLTVLSFFSTWVLKDNIYQLIKFELLGILFILFFGASVWFYIKIIFPVTASSKSLIYFGGVSSRSLDEFQQEVNELDESKITHEYTGQVHALAGIAEKKFKNFKYALIFSVLTLVVSILLGICDAKNEARQKHYEFFNTTYPTGYVHHVRFEF